MPVHVNALSLFACCCFHFGSYARDNAVVALRGVEVSDNFVTRGSAIFVVNSELITSQVNERSRQAWTNQSMKR